MTEEINELTANEWKKIRELGKRAAKSETSISDLLSQVSKHATKLASLREKTRNTSREALALIYEVFIRAATNEEEAKAVSDLSQISEKRGGKVLNLFIAKTTGLSKQRSYMLSLVLRKATSDGIEVTKFKEWLADVENLDTVGKEYAKSLQGRSTEKPEASSEEEEEEEAPATKPASRGAKSESIADEEDALRLGDGWEILSDIFSRAKKKNREVKINVRVRCKPDGQIDLIERSHE